MGGEIFVLVVVFFPFPLTCSGNRRWKGLIFQLSLSSLSHKGACSGIKGEEDWGGVSPNGSVLEDICLIKKRNKEDEEEYIRK